MLAGLAVATGVYRRRQTVYFTQNYSICANGERIKTFFSKRGTIFAFKLAHVGGKTYFCELKPCAAIALPMGNGAIAQRDIKR